MRVQAEIDAELARQRIRLSPLGDEMTFLLTAVESLLRGGKRLRAVFCYWGYRGAGGTAQDGALRAATAMEFFQAAALLHDDVMDESDTRRGRPTAHRSLADLHRLAGWGGAPDRFGTAGAILAGNLCLVWTDEMVATCGLPPDQLTRARPVFDVMRTQLMGGQFLDVLVSARGWEDLTTAQRIEQAQQVIRYKSAQYSIEQPLLFGALAAGADEADLTALSRYGLDLGEAFQLRDDVLGVFGDPEQTGKPAGDDLREGKRTLLVALALDGAGALDRDYLTDRLGRADLAPAEIEQLRRILLDSGAVELVEDRIRVLSQAAREHLGGVRGLSDEGRDVLDHLIDVSTARAF